MSKDGRKRRKRSAASQQSGGRRNRRPEDEPKARDSIGRVQRGRASRPVGDAPDQLLPSDEGNRHVRIASYWPALAIVVVVAAAYAPVTRCGYIWDDDAYVTNNPTLRSGDGLRRIWFQPRATPQYYPLVHTTYWLEYRLWRLNPTGYHVVNILLHAVGAILLWRVLLALNVPGAWVAAAIFALHPMQVESAAWITERKNVLSGVFYFGAALTYLKHALAPANEWRRSPSTLLYATSLLLFLCALLSKTVTCTLPAALLLVLWWKRGRMDRKDAGALAPFFTIGIVFGLLTVWLEKYHVGATGEHWNLSLIERFLLAGRVLCFYAGKLFWPTQLTFVYTRWQIDAAVWQQYVYPLAVMGVVSMLWLARGRTGRGPLVAVLFCVGTLFPALGFFDVYPMRFSYVADHFQYLAGVGLITLSVVSGSLVIDRLAMGKKRIAKLVSVLILATLGTLTWRQGHIYESRETLWRDTVQKNPGAWIAQYSLAKSLSAQGRLAEAIDHYRTAMKITPNSSWGHNNLGLALRKQGKLDEAVSHYRQALRWDSQNAEGHFNLGNALAVQDKLDEAIRHYRAGLKIRPDVVKPYNSLGVALKSQGRLDEAISVFRRALSVKPDFLEARTNLGIVLSMTGQREKALEHFTEAMRLKPGWGEPMWRTAWILATHPDPKVREPEKAIRLAERAAELTRRQDAQVLDALAAAYAAAGRFELAAAAANEALELASVANADELADCIRKRLELYRQARPYREPARNKANTPP